MPVFAILFESASTANFRVAGIPAAARAVRAVRDALTAQGLTPDEIVVAVPGGWLPSPECCREITRLVPRLAVRFAGDLPIDDSEHIPAFRGEESLEASRISRLVDAPSDSLRDETTLHLRMRARGRAIVDATGKTSDGVVSRYLNRPISMAITRLVLRLPGISPMHATAAAALVGLTMAALLFSGSQAGLIASAILFQLASVIDGVDGEIARATFRTSDLGARLDSLTDAATNFAFVAGLTLAMYRQSEIALAGAGIAGLVAHGSGYFLLGRRSVNQGAPMTFDALKTTTFSARSALVRYATHLFARDFYVAASVVMVLCGLTRLLLPIYAALASLWLALVIVFLLSRRSRATAEAR